MKIKYCKQCESIKLCIKEDTACIPSKTSYMEDGFYNGIYYFGDPKKPMDWRDAFKTKKRGKNKKLKESYEDGVEYVALDSKIVKDSDGFNNEYTLYAVITDVLGWNDFKAHSRGRSLPDRFIDKYVAVFGDSDIYNPNYDDTDFDFETEDKYEAREWFDNFTGFDEEFEEW